MNQAGQDVDMEIQRQEEIRAELQRGAEKMVRESLQYTTPITPAHAITMANMSSSSSSSATPMLTESTVPQPPTRMLVGREGEQQKTG